MRVQINQTGRDVKAIAFDDLFNTGTCICTDGGDSTIFESDICHGV
jgi:hypothetical protein